MKRLLMAMVALALTALLFLSDSWEPGSASAQSFSVVSSGEAHTCALTASGGAVWCWGRNVEGELGIGTVSAPYTQANSPLPVCASGSWNGTTCSGGAALTGVYAISAGSVAAQSCATIVYLILECWGLNSDGQVGNGTTTTRIVHPGVVLCQSTASYCNGTYHFLAGIVGIAAGGAHTCALDQAGYVWCWGYNAAGALGDGTTVGRAFATRVCATGSGQDCPNGTLLSGVTAIAAGQDFTCALTTSGGIKCWGYNYDGELGDGTTSNRSLPVNVSGLSSGVASIAVGNSHACAVLTSGGVAKCWGLNENGEVGDGTQASKTTPTTVCASAPAACPGSSLSGVSKLTAGSNHTCAVTTALSVKCWGENSLGQLGTGGAVNYGALSTVPVDWVTPANQSWTPQASALSGGGAHTCAIISTFVECWGWNGNGQLGNGSSAGFLDETTTWVGQDTDKDGCPDSRELGSGHTTGGQRDPTSVWDFFDTPDSNNVRDKIVNDADVNRISARFLSTGNPNADPLLPPPAAPAYSSAFDRASTGPNPWNLGPGDGQITVADMLFAIHQEPDNCTGAP